MGNDHTNSNDNGKGADIFNNVSGLIGKAIEIFNKYISVCEGDPSGIYFKGDLRTAKSKIIFLDNASKSFAKYREEREFRTAFGGSGDPENALKFSVFSQNILRELTALFPPELNNDLRNGKKMHSEDLHRTFQVRNKVVLDGISGNSTIDRQARDARMNELAKNRRNEFNNWYVEAENQLILTFNEFNEVVEHLQFAKKQIYKQKRITSMLELHEDKKKRENKR